MAGRLMCSRASPLLLRRALRSLVTPTSAVLPCPGNITFRFRPDNFGSSSANQMRLISTTISKFPEVADADVLHALRLLIAVKWTEIPDEAKDAVEAALSKQSSDTAGIEQLKNAWRAAEAVETFSGTLVSIRMALDDLTGFSGERVRPLPPLLQDALKSAFSRYKNYLAAFNADEFYLKKKVEVELGSLLVHLKQRCSGLGPEWGEISLVGTTGLSGSFIELRAH
ncbi:hypothetical protein KP509_34G061800 [Ceratopteris richardii]|uniref:Succinate dehydrogenase subunit 5, mitochondrial n=1 Tax=Ceratopteris richardii TaxID=49495 RepID=A0A8T2QM04_CERRI|nr:hypothetical protein KP509_34G061800 [Ceratopteris richardii]